MATQRTQNKSRKSVLIREGETREIERDQWIPFLAEFTRENRGAHATLEVIKDEIGDQLETEDRPFDGASADVKDAECALWITFGSTPSEHITHGIQDVTALRILPGGPQRGDVLEVEADDGTKTLLILTRPEDFALPPAAE